MYKKEAYIHYQSLIKSYIYIYIDIGMYVCMCVYVSMCVCMNCNNVGIWDIGKVYLRYALNESKVAYE